MADLKSSVLSAAGRSEVIAALSEVYSTLADEIARVRPVCVVSGRCCRFEEYGHRLYVTTIELAGFWAGQQNRPAPNPRSLVVWDGTGCPYQAGGLCTVHAIRPFGCRIFFCDASSSGWQQTLYERLHARLRELHDRFQVPYNYVEWRFALEELRLTAAPEP